MKGSRSFPIPLLLALLSVRALGQGCSDAGVCTAGPIGDLHLWQDSTADATTYRHTARIGYSYAIGERGTTIMQISPEVSIGIGKKFAVQAKLPIVATDGVLGDNSGIGDVIATISYAFIKEKDRNLTGVLGMRLPTGNTDARAPVRVDPGSQTGQVLSVAHLPMPYQTGLGTTDLLAGVNWRYQRYVVGLAFQQVLSQRNANEFTHEAWSNDPTAAGYFESRELERASDLVARVQYAYGCGRLAMQPGLLAIYHLMDDSRLNDIATNMEMGTERMDIAGSQGLTLNLTADLRYKLAERWGVEASAGMPLVTRKARPDGLTREFVLEIGFSHRFGR